MRVCQDDLCPPSTPDLVDIAEIDTSYLLALFDLALLVVSVSQAETAKTTDDCRCEHRLNK